MRLAVSACLVAILSASSANAQVNQASSLKLCILNAAQKLPNIPGLAIINARTMPPPEFAKGTKVSVWVEIDFKAAGQEATAAFACAPGENERPTMVTPAGIK